MAVQAQQTNNPLPSQLITNRDFIKGNQGNYNMYNTQRESGLVLPGTESQVVFPMYQPVYADQADSGLTYNVPESRKRPRDSINELYGFPASQKCRVSSLVDQDIAYQLQQQQSEINFIIAQHTEKMRLEVEQQVKNQTRMILSAICHAFSNKLKDKNEEIERVTKLNWVLQERVRSLNLENQLWRELAQNNEAAANTLRSNLEQVLAAQVPDNQGVMVADDAESICGSNDYGREDALADSGCNGGDSSRMCRQCGERESIVLLMPCRHLCLCTVCGSSVHTCPVCKSFTNGSVHVNMY